MIARQNFADREDLAKNLAVAIASALKAAIAARCEASIAFSGGSTPGLLFQMLSRDSSIAWQKVTVTLVDERWVGDQDARSNARLLADNLLQNAAKAARFVPLYSGGAAPDQAAIARTDTALKNLVWPLDVVVLGMGADGHTASFFPGGDNLDAAFAENGPTIAMRAPGAGEPRITLTLARIIGAKNLFLHIEGDAKQQVLAKALAEIDDRDTMPVRAVLAAAYAPVAVYWCP